MYQVSYYPNPKQKKILETIQERFPKSFVAGGAIRDGILRIEPKDYDIYFPCEMDAVSAYNICCNSNKYRVPDDIVTASVMGHKFIMDGETKIDIITGLCGEPEQVIHSMDFTCYQVFWKDDCTFALDEQVLGAIDTRQLIPTEWINTHPGNTAKRMIKLIARGWTITRADVYEVIMAAAKEEAIRNA